MQVVVNNTITPDFLPAITLCAGNTAPLLNNASPNGVTGSWSPSVISNALSGPYTFTPSGGQCAAGFTTNVTVTSSNLVPDFPVTITVCLGSVAPLLNATSPNGISGSWSPPTIDNTTSASYIFTPNAGQCATSLTTNVTVTSFNITPNFPPSIPICSGTTAPLLNNTSPNGIVGSWSPTTINNTTNGSYVFTPNAVQCATTFTTLVTVTSPTIVPNFVSTLSLCSGTIAPILNSTSPNGIVGSWSPTTINNTTNGSYVFTPNAGQCATSFTSLVTVTNPTIVPNFVTSLSLCSGTTAPILNSTSPNGIIGSWSPTTINNTVNGNYTFTPNVGQCATTVILAVTITPLNITPIFNTLSAICSGDAISPLPTTSTNGIIGTWSPVLDNTMTKLYTFFPNAGQCATTTTASLVVTPKITPDFVANMSFCAGAAVPSLNATSPNGIVGTWSPPTINNLASNSYTFLPNVGQCANPVVLSVAISNDQFLTKSYALCVDSSGNALFPVAIDSGLSPLDYTFTWTKAGNSLPVTDYFYATSEVSLYQIIATNRVTGCIITIDVNVFANPPATAIAYVTEDFSDQQEIVVAVTGGLGDFLYQLDYGPFQQSNVFFNSIGGDHIIHVKDTSGCNAFELQVTSLSYPKFFTPNDDGYHDFWNVAGMQPFQRGSISIFDRYGKLLKQISPNGEGWSGKYNGNALPSDDYWFVISYQSITGESKSFRSHFSLKR
jgi:gliding motility-associated-like protein